MWRVFMKDLVKLFYHHSWYWHAKSLLSLSGSIQIIIITYYYFFYSVTGFLMTRHQLGMRRGDSAKTLVETWPPLIRDTQKVCPKIFSFFCLCAKKTHLLFTSSTLLYSCANNFSWPSQLLVFLLSKMAEHPDLDIWIGLRSIEGDEFHWTDGQPRKYARNVLLVSVWQPLCLNCIKCLVVCRKHCKNFNVWQNVKELDRHAKYLCEERHTH